MTKAKWSMMIGAVVAASSVFAGAAFAANGGHKGDPAAVEVADDQQIRERVAKSAIVIDAQTPTPPKGDVFAANGDKADPTAAHGVAEKQALMDQSEKRTYAFDKQAVSSPEALQADLDARVAGGLITRDQADILYAKVSANMGW